MVKVMKELVSFSLIEQEQEHVSHEIHGKRRRSPVSGVASASPRIRWSSRR